MFLTDRSYAEHLEVTHELMDDEGTRTTLRAARSLAGDALVPVAVEEPAAAEPAPTVDPSRIYDPDSENPYRATALAVLVLLLLFGSGWTIMRSMGKGGGDDVVAALEQDGGGSTLELASDKVSGSSSTVDPDGGAGSAVPAATEPATTDTSTPDTTVAAPAPTPAPTPAPAQNRAPPPPPTTAPPPPPPPALSFLPPTVSGLRLDECPSNRGSVATWRFSYVLVGGTNWAPNPSATQSAGRYSESRESRFRDISVTAIGVRNALTGALVYVDVPDLTSDNCP